MTKKGMLGRKLGMTQQFLDNGEVVPLTVIEAGPCIVVQNKTKSTDGYDAIQLGFSDQKPYRLNQPIRGHFKKAGTIPKRYLKEIEVDDVRNFELGQELKVEEIFKPGEHVDITGISRGKGFQGVLKRWNFKGGKASHGAQTHRAPGSIGAGTDPGRIWKGKKLPGRTGSKRVTVQNLEVVKVDPEKGLLLVRGAVPGARDGLLIVRESVKRRS